MAGRRVQTALRGGPIPHRSSCVPDLSQAHPGVVDRVGPSYGEAQDGGGSLGVVTRLTLRTRELPQFFGVVAATIKATSDAAFRRLIGEVIAFYAERLFNPHWGEQIVFGRSNTLRISMLFQDLTQQQAVEVWRPFFERVAAAPREFEFVSPPRIGAVPARRFWDTTFLRQAPGIVVADDRPNATVSNVFWAADAGQVGQFLHGYQSTWLPSALLQEGGAGASRRRAVRRDQTLGIRAALQQGPRRSARR